MPAFSDNNDKTRGRVPALPPPFSWDSLFLQVHASTIIRWWRHAVTAFYTACQRSLTTLLIINPRRQGGGPTARLERLDTFTTTLLAFARTAPDTAHTPLPHAQRSSADGWRTYFRGGTPASTAHTTPAACHTHPASHSLEVPDYTRCYWFCAHHTIRDTPHTTHLPPRHAHYLHAPRCALRLPLRTLRTHAYDVVSGGRGAAPAAHCAF